MRIRKWVLAELGGPAEMLACAAALREKGFEVDTYSPYPVEGASEALKLGRSFMPIFTLAAGLFGAALMYAVQWFTNAVDYPINVGGRPPYAPATNVPLMYEFGILLSASAAFFGLMLLFKFPRLYHPVFEVDAFRNATRDGFWVSVTTHLPNQAEAAEADMLALGARQISRVDEKVHR